MENKKFKFKDEIKKLTEHTDKIQEPNHIFEIKYSDEKNKKFDSLKVENTVSYAFHGSRFENFYSILNIGLLSHFNKVGDVIFQQKQIKYFSNK